MKVINSDRFDDVEFLPEGEFKIIGTAGGVDLYLVGKDEDGEEIVAKELPNSELFAIPMYELLSHSQDKIVLYDQPSTATEMSDADRESANESISKLQDAIKKATKKPKKDS
ncbi:hypothetical protein 2AV2_18 [Nodularia phage vB_NpeS-2AV2]|jgi:hypothetical protein|uniref:Uncharacterized protein n=3 Tax=Ravarandavirus TaxID=2843444 RepID=A0A482MKQ3_9CAUD|nr:hypothetical protein HWA92_gp018 [Nodularia phage vB_NpeS-2AV2]YP_009844833.1 hypothetical protein HWC13_gp024 [Nodularia phage vB_NspS-kac68v161]ALY07470.1 hypothetical protein 2AV2_18 [Nodularia phage vB_NpeS-2AV2]QBQ73674.1 hypothetical protein kac68v161_gp024 [Nodularia phage vB_NspS-kac68v161]QBQ73872.1 hypothetical protein kac68v162_gp024 [Nodularia phage vB_NspS-kac68v162]